MKRGIPKMTEPNKQQPEESRPKKEIDTKPKRRRGRPEKMFKIEDTPENVARAMWGVRSTKFEPTEPKSDD